MEHYLLLGLAALVIFLLLMSIGPRIARTSPAGGNDFLSSPSDNGFAPNHSSKNNTG